MSERYYWIDYAKVFGIFLVVLGHFTPDVKETYSSQVLYSFHLPLFFIISGYLYKEKRISYTEQVYHLFKRLFIPYVLLCAIGTCFEWAFMRGEIPLNISVAKSIILGRPVGMIGPMWFVYTLFLIKLIHVTQNHLRKRTKMIFYLSGFILGGYLLYGIITNTPPSLPPFINCMIIAYPLYLFGEKFHWIEALFDKLKWPFKIIITTSLLIMPFLSVPCNGFVDLWLNVFGKSFFLYYLFGILGSIGVLFSFKCFAIIKSSMIMTLSNGTLLIIAFHNFLLHCLEGFGKVFLVRIIVCLLVVFAFYYPIVIIQKYFPILIGKSR